MRVLITGASGFVGSYVISLLESNGIDYIAIGRKQPKNAPDDKFINADLLESPDWNQIMRHADASVLMHLAWYAEHGRYWTSSLNLHWVNATIRMTEAFCNTGGRHVVIAGTCAEYDWSYGYCREDATPLQPATLYGTAKDATRRLTMEICRQYGVPCAWGRIFLPFGPGESPERLIPSLIASLRGEREPFRINTGAYRDFLQASDVASAFITLAKAEACGVFNISSGQPIRLAEVVQTLASLLTADPEPLLRLGSAPSGDPPLLVGESLKIRALGWEPESSLEQGLTRYIDLSR